MPRTAIAICLLLGTMVACSPKGRIVQEEPAWKSKEGRLQIRLDLVTAMINASQYVEALHMLNTLKEAGHKDPRLDLFQGKCMSAQGLYTEAEAFLLKAQTVMKRAPEPWHELGVLYADSGQIDKAVAAFQAAVEADDKRAMDWNNLGFLLFSQKNYVEATVALRTAVSLDPTKERYRSNLAFSLFGEGNQEEAFRVFKSMLSAADAHYNMGVAHELSGDNHSAAEQYLLATNANPNHKAALEAQQRLNAIKESME